MVKRANGHCEFCPLDGGYCPVCDWRADATEADGYQLLMRCLCFGGGFFLGCGLAVVFLHFWK